MKRTELLKRIGRYVTVVMMAMLAMVAAGCGGDDEEPIGEYYIGPDKDGWYKYKDEYSVYVGEVVTASEDCVQCVTTSPLWRWIVCANLSKADCNDCNVGDTIKIRIQRFKMAEFQTQEKAPVIYAEVELLNVKKQ